jgi:conjugative transfer signal peptidase TraF
MCYVLQLWRILAAHVRKLLLYLRYDYLLLVIPAGMLALPLVGSQWIGWNSSASAAPIGLYLRRKPQPKRGQLVEVCLPPAVARFGIARGYINHGWSCPDGSEPLGKIIAGMPGDTLWIDPATVLKADSRGRPMDHFPFGAYRLKPGEVWLYGSNPKSFDSRYFGPVPMANVRANLAPLWTWGKP